MPSGAQNWTAFTRSPRRADRATVDLANVIISGISAAVAVVSAIVAGVSALRSREAKEIAEKKRDEAVDAAVTVASATTRIAAVHGSRQATEAVAQASSVVVVIAKIQAGFSGWRVQNDSDQPVTNVAVRAADGGQIVVYRGSGTDHVPEYTEPVVGAHRHSEKMFRPTGDGLAGCVQAASGAHHRR